jgi:predicted metal-dependent hydrolase
VSAPEPAEPVLTDEDKRAVARAAEEFNSGRFFECHDTLEEVWAGVRGPSRDFFQGLIQVSVAFYHLTRGNAAGAESLFGRALARLGRYPERYFGFELAHHRAEVAAWLERARSGDLSCLGREPLPLWRFAGLGRPQDPASETSSR